jgi:hypothetical protein
VPSELTTEHLRILRAANEGRLALKINSDRWCITPKVTGEWSMETEPLPDHKSRRTLQARGLIDHPRYDPPPADRPWLRIDSRRLVLTDKGREALDATTGQEKRL